MSNTKYLRQLDALHRSVISGDDSGLGIIKQQSKPEFSAQARLSVYSGGYRARLIGAVKADYPASRHLIGENECDVLIADYVKSAPSKHWDLNQYPVGFAAYLQGRVASSIAAVAELEAAIADVFWMADSAPLALEKLAGLSEEGLQQQHFSLRTASRLLALDYDAQGYVQAFRAGEAPTEVKAGTCYLLVYRHLNSVRRLALEEAAYTLLLGIDQGKCFGEAVFTLNEAQQETLAQSLGGWLSAWLQAGVFQDRA